MSTREQFKPTHVLNATTGQSMTGNLTSLVTIIPGLSLFSYDISWVGVSPVGTLQVEGSNTYTLDARGNASAPGNWNVIPFVDSTGTIVTSIGVSGNTGNGMIALADVPFYAIRLVYVFGSGTGTLDAVAAGKVS